MSGGRGGEVIEGALGIQPSRPASEGNGTPAQTHGSTHHCARAAVTGGAQLAVALVSAVGTHANGDEIQVLGARAVGAVHDRAHGQTQGHLVLVPRLVGVWQARGSGGQEDCKMTAGRRRAGGRAPRTAPEPRFVMAPQLPVSCFGGGP